MPDFEPVGYGNPLPIGFGSSSDDIWWPMRAVTISRAAIIARLNTWDLTNFKIVFRQPVLSLHRVN
jgi:hypothetical protein